MEISAHDRNTLGQAASLHLSNPGGSSRPAPEPVSLGSGLPTSPTAKDIKEERSRTDAGSGWRPDPAKRRYKHEVDRFANRFAAIQSSQHNAGLFRGFDYPHTRCLSHKQARIVHLQRQLEDYENDPTTDKSGLTAGQTRMVGDSTPFAPDRHDQLIEAMMKELAEYDDMLLRYTKIQALIPAHPEEVNILYKKGLADDMIDESSYAPAYELADFVYARPHLVHNDIRPFLYSRVGKFLLSRLVADRQFSSRGLLRALQAAAVLVDVVMLLLPTGLLYLAELSKTAAFGLVVGFAVAIFVALVVAGATFQHLLVGSCAYAALLLTVLVQTQDGGGGCSCL